MGNGTTSGLPADSAPESASTGCFAGLLANMTGTGAPSFPTPSDKQLNDKIAQLQMSDENFINKFKNAPDDELSVWVEKRQYAHYILKEEWKLLNKPALDRTAAEVLAARGKVPNGAEKRLARGGLPVDEKANSRSSWMNWAADKAVSGGWADASNVEMAKAKAKENGSLDAEDALPQAPAAKGGKSGS